MATIVNWQGLMQPQKTTLDFQITVKFSRNNLTLSYKNAKMLSEKLRKYLKTAKSFMGKDNIDRYLRETHKKFYTKTFRQFSEFKTMERFKRQLEQIFNYNTCYFCKKSNLEELTYEVSISKYYYMIHRYSCEIKIFCDENCLNMHLLSNI